MEWAEKFDASNCRFQKSGLIYENFSNRQWNNLFAPAENLLTETTFKISEYSKINIADVKNFDALVLSGGHDFSVKGNEDRVQREIDLVKNFTKPIFGICFGFEIIAGVFGATLERMGNKEKGVIDIELVEPDELFLNGFLNLVM